MDFEAKWGSIELKLSAYASLIIFSIIGVACIVAAFIPMHLICDNNQCVDKMDDDGTVTSKCTNKDCPKVTHYWLAGVGAGAIILGVIFFYMFKSFSHNRTMSQMTAISDQANMVAGLFR
jgi:hypothetical protein